MYESKMFDNWADTYGISVENTKNFPSFSILPPGKLLFLIFCAGIITINLRIKEKT